MAAASRVFLAIAPKARYVNLAKHPVACVTCRSLLYLAHHCCGAILLIA